MSVATMPLDLSSVEDEETSCAVNDPFGPIRTIRPAVADVHNMQAVSSMEWPHMGPKMQPLSTIPNLRHLLDNYGFTVRYDVIRKDMQVTHPGQRGARDNVRSKAIDTVTSLCALNQLPRVDVPGYLLSIADDNQFNPVADYLISRPWDQVSRFGDLLGTIETRPGFDRELLATLLRRWLISAVAAAVKPSGFWSKGVLVFQGDQSLGKTAWIRSLLPPELRDLVKVDAILDPNNKDSIISAVSHWLVELGELDGTLRKADIARLKGFISRDVDQFRRPYGRTEEKFQRRTVFFASVNPEQFLVDDSGNVRFWTIPVVGINHSHGIDMQQLWAEVLSWLMAGEKWWLDRDEEAKLEGANATHQQGDSWESRIADYCVGRDTVDVSCVLEALGVELARQGKGEQMRAASALRVLGYHRTKKRFGTATRWVWMKAGVQDEDRPF